MDNYSEGLATGMALNQGNHGYCGGYPVYAAYPYMGGCGGGLGGFGFGGGWEGIIGLIAVASIFGNGGWGFGGGNNRGNCATQADLAAGFNNSAVLSNLNDITLAQSQGFAGVQQTLCQGFSGVNATVNTVGNTINQGICNLGYELQGAFNGVSRQIADCCCDLKTMNLENRYLNEKQTCDLRNAIYNSTRDIIDSNRCGFDRIAGMLTQQEMDRLRSENQTLRFEKSQATQNAFFTANQDAQTAELIRRLGRDCPVPAYVVPNPNCCYNYNISGVGYGQGGCGNNCCGF